MNAGRKRRIGRGGKEGGGEGAWGYVRDRVTISDLGAYVYLRVSHERLEPIIEWWAVDGDDKTGIYTQ